MNVSPSVVVTRFAQLESGDLFIVPSAEEACVAMKVREPDGDSLMVPLGPVFPGGTAYPSLMAAPFATVISFGKEYTLRLPSQAAGWTTDPPAPEIQGIVVAESSAYLRANFVPAHQGYRPCYIDMSMGVIVSAGKRPSLAYIAPSGHLAYAVGWEILTTEEDPRAILAYPW